MIAPRAGWSRTGCEERAPEHAARADPALMPRPRVWRRSSRHALAVGAALATALGLGGCPHHPVHIERAYPPPTAAVLREALVARQRAVTTLNARARATSWLGGDRIRATVLMLVDRPGRLRFEAEVTLQGTVAVLTTDGQRFAFLDAQKNEVRRGPACPANVASLIRIPLGPSDVAAILLGDARLPESGAALTAVAAAASPSPDPALADRVDWDAEAGADVLDVPRAGGRLRYLIQRVGGGAGAGVDRDRIRVVGVVAQKPDGAIAWRVSFEDFTDVRPTPSLSSTPPSSSTPPAAPTATISLPETVRFAEGSGSFDDGVEIKFKDRAVNEPLAADAFAFTAPPAATTVEVGCP
jgi:hypothetical protein